MQIKQLRQAVADNNREQAALKAEGRKLMGIAADARTPEQIARLTAIEGELDALTAKAEGIANDLARAERFAQDDINAHATHVSVGHDNAEDKPWGPRVGANAPAMVQLEAQHIALGNFALAVKAAATGAVDSRLHAAATGMGTQVDSSMGFAVPNEVAPGIEREMYETGEVLSRCDVRTIGGNSISYNVLDETSRADGTRGSGVLGYWVDEGTAPTLSSMKLSRIDMKLRKVGALGAMTDELISDAAALGGELAGAFAEELTFQVENKIWRGAGANSIQGFLNAACLVSVAKESGQTAATINTKNLSKMWARMPARSQKNSAWFVNVDCLPQLDELILPAGTGGVQPRFVNYGPDGILTIKGRPVVPVEYAETLGTQGDIALVDLKKYRVIRKGGVEQASSMHVYFAQGEQAFRAFYRVDGQAVPRAAVTPFKGSATLSPFVVLDTRS
jgi:HK97 family phage major capsid protein